MSYRDPEKRRKTQREWKRKNKAPKWHQGGPGRKPLWAREGFAVEPACKPSKGPMRPEHSYDEDGICTACGATRTKFAPRPEPVEIVAKPRKLRTGLDDGPLLPRARPGKGASHKPSPAHRAAFASQTLTPAPREDVATIPDPLAAALAALELERDEITIAIETLKRLRGRQASA